MTGYIYLLEEFRNDDIGFKIGFTRDKDISKRIKPLQTGNSSEIAVLYTYETKNYLKLEKMLHKRYNPKHKRGEWFSLEQNEVSNFITECKKLDNIINVMLNNNIFYN